MQSKEFLKTFKTYRRRILFKQQIVTEQKLTHGLRHQNVILSTNIALFPSTTQSACSAKMR